MSVPQLEIGNDYSRRYKVSLHASVAAAFLLAACIWNIYVLPIGMGIVLLGVLLVAFLGLTALIYAGVYLWKLVWGPPRQPPPSPTKPKRGRRIQVWWIVLWSFVFVVLTWYNIPRKAAFFLFRPQFTALQTLPLTPPAKGSWLGPWKVKSAKVDERGGLYLVAGEAMDGIDTISAGPAYQPNRTGSPFGRADYTLHHLHGDWYWFHTSNDW